MKNARRLPILDSFSNRAASDGSDGFIVFQKYPNKKIIWLLLLKRPKSVTSVTRWRNTMKHMRRYRPMVVTRYRKTPKPIRGNCHHAPTNAAHGDFAARPDMGCRTAPIGPHTRPDRSGQFVITTTGHAHDHERSKTPTTSTLPHFSRPPKRATDRHRLVRRCQSTHGG